MKHNKENSSRMTGNKHTSWMSVCVSIGALFVSIFLSVSTVHAFEVVLKPAVSIHGEAVLLRDILTEDSRATCTDESLLATQIARAPRPGKSRKISRALVALRLKNNKVDIREFSFGGANSVAVAREHQLLTKETIEEYMFKLLVHSFDVDQDATRLIIENMVESLPLSPGNISLSHDKRRVILKNGYLHIRLIVCVDGKEVLKKLVSAKVYSERNVVVARQVIRPREIIDASFLSAERMCVPFNAEYYTDINEVSGKLASVYIASGEAIGFKDIKEQPAIRKGDAVKVTINRKSMTVNVTLQALEAGRAGESIRLYSKETRKHFVGKIIREGVVEVEL